jgi:hypothetical protein
MKTIAGVALIALLSARGTLAPGPRVPVLVELFTSEGCSSCPPADQLLAVLQREQPVAAAEIIVLGLHVDYWDQLGWKDQFASASFTERQQQYSRIFGPDRVYTPQMVVDGQVEFVGSDRSAAERAVTAAAGRPHLPVHVTARMAADSMRLVIDLPAAPAESEPIQVIAALTESSVTSAVRRGENSGRTLQHVAVARKVQGLGSLGADAFVTEGQWRVDRGWGATGLNAVVWLQGAKTRHVYGTATAPVAR